MNQHSAIVPEPNLMKAYDRLLQRGGLPVFVVGLLFNLAHTQVALVRKNRPPAQVGKLNGVGGRVNEGETIEQAMRREFLEEAGVAIDNWQPVFRLAYPHAVIWFLRADADADQWGGVRSVTDERVLRFQLKDGMLERHDLVPDLRWMIPLAVQPGVQLPLMANATTTPDPNMLPAEVGGVPV